MLVKCFLARLNTRNDTWGGGKKKGFEENSTLKYTKRIYIYTCFMIVALICRVMLHFCYSCEKSVIVC